MKDFVVKLSSKHYCYQICTSLMEDDDDDDDDDDDELFCGMVDGRKSFSLISSRDHRQRSLPSRISDMPRARFGPEQNLSSGLVE